MTSWDILLSTYIGLIKVQVLYLEFHAYRTVVLLAVNILVGFFRKYFKMYCTVCTCTLSIFSSKLYKYLYKKVNT